MSYIDEQAASYRRVEDALLKSASLDSPPREYRQVALANTQRVVAIPAGLRQAKKPLFDKCEVEAHCRMCQRHMRVRPLTRHHLVPLRWWKHIDLEWRSVRNCPNNIIPLCRGCHDLIESPDREIRVEARRMLRRSLSQAEIAFAIAARGKEWFEQQYPTNKQS